MGELPRLLVTARADGWGRAQGYLLSVVTSEYMGDVHDIILYYVHIMSVIQDCVRCY